MEENKNLEETKKIQMLFDRESKTPIPLYPFPKFDPDMDIIERRYHFNNFSEWEKKYLKKIEILTNLAEKIFVSPKNTGIMVITTRNKIVFIVFSVLKELLQKTTQREFRNHEKEIVWEVIKRHVASQKAKLKNFAK